MLIVGDKKPVSFCCSAPIRYQDIKRPLGDEGPFNTIILWCQNCGKILGGNGQHIVLHKITD